MNAQVKQADPDDFMSLLEFLHATPVRVSELIARLSDSERRWRNSESEFSALENICHLRDLEVQGYAPRITRILEETNPTLPDFDGARVAAEIDYDREHTDFAYLTFTLKRRENVRKLKSLTEEQLQREGMLEGVGKITLKRLAEMMREHDEGHLEDLRVLRQRIENRRQNANV